MEQYKLQKGDEQFVRFMENGQESYALCEYVGRDSDDGYIFRSMTYGWKYIVNREKTKVTREADNPRVAWTDKEYEISNRTGWLAYLPN